MKQFRIKIFTGGTKQEVATQINSFVKENADLMTGFMGEKEDRVPYIQSVYEGNDVTTYESQLAFYLNPKGVTNMTI